MIRYGDLTLKGKNQKKFRQVINTHIGNIFCDLDVNIEYQHDMVYIRLNDTDPDEVISRLNYIAGLSSYSKVIKCEYDLDLIAKHAIEMIRYEYGDKPVTFKVETKRANKDIPITSQAISKKISAMVLRNIENLSVDVHDPDFILNIEVRKDASYIYTNKIQGMGGYPVSIGGKALVLLSGGIDSPVSAYLAMKKGLEVECLHFESTPMTSIESAQKAIDLTEKLARFAPNAKIKLHFVPFQKLHEQIIFKIPEAYVITIMRRMMYRIADKVAKANDCLAIVSGDSIGQVASQTLENMNVIQAVTDHLIIRPLATYDKLEIIDLASRIDTFEISNRPFSDCCTVYVPKRPIIKPSIQKAELFEADFPYEKYLLEAIDNVKTVEVSANKHLDIQGKGLTVAECFE